MPYNPTIHHRRSIRLKGYDYSQAGLYFVTICVNVGAHLRVHPNEMRPHLFGNVVNGEMILNDAGKMVEKWCMELSNKFPDIVVDTYIIMPNHFHAIIVNNGGGGVGADLCVCPDEPPNIRVCPDEPPNIRVCPDETQKHENNILGEHAGSPLHRVVQWFKTMTTNEYIRGVKTLGWQPFNKKLWQRNYYEHIIRNEQAYQHIANYIINNPMKWKEDKFFTE